MARGRMYSDEQLELAIAAAGSWRGVLRDLGLAATSAGAMRSIRQYADRLGIDYAHLDTRRPPSKAGRRAVTPPRSSTGTGQRAGGAVEKDEHVSVELDGTSNPGRPDTSQLSRAGPLLAAAWFTLCGEDVSWPLEPCRYDLLVTSRSGVRRVQVKTTTTRAGRTWKVYLSTSRRGRSTSGPEEIDDFFIIDGDLNYYVIPVGVVGGLHAVHLSAYAQHQVELLHTAT